MTSLRNRVKLTSVKKIFGILVLCFILVGCATPYQPKGLMGGFEDISLGDNKHKITWQGNGYTSKAKLIYYTERRASEICKSGFDILDKDYDVVGSLGPFAGAPVLVTTIKCKQRTKFYKKVSMLETILVIEIAVLVIAWYITTQN